MSIDDLKQISRRALEFWSSANNDRPEDIFAEHYINHQEPDAEGGISDKDLAAWKQLLSEYHDAFSDSKVRILMQIAEPNVVSSRWEFEATHRGEFLGHEATGQRVIWTGVQIDRFQSGKIVESWVVWDKFRFLEQLGFVK